MLEQEQDEEQEQDDTEALTLGFDQNQNDTLWHDDFKKKRKYTSSGAASIWVQLPFEYEFF